MLGHLGKLGKLGNKVEMLVVIYLHRHLSLVSGSIGVSTFCSSETHERRQHPSATNAEDDLQKNGVEGVGESTTGQKGFPPLGFFWIF